MHFLLALLHHLRDQVQMPLGARILFYFAADMQQALFRISSAVWPYTFFWKNTKLSILVIIAF